MSVRTFSNIGAADRAVRLLLGAMGLALAVSGPRSPWGYLGVALLLTAAIGFCPLYAVLGISTRSRRTP